MRHLGWILDLYHKNGQMIVWLKKPDGSCVNIIDEWKPRVHVCGEFPDLLDLACSGWVTNSKFVEKFEKAGDKAKSKVLETKVNSDIEAASLADRIQKLGNYSKFRLYDVDIPSVQMYLYHKDLFPLAFVEAEESSRGVCWRLRDTREEANYELPPLRIVRLELETEKEAPVQSFNDKLDTVRVIDWAGEAIVLDSGDETERILGLVNVFKDKDPDIVLTRGGDSFIFPFLSKRAEENEILDKLVLGREVSPLRVYEVQGHSYFSYGKILYRDTAARILGRLHIDESNAFISSDCDLEGLFEVSRTCIIPLQRASRATIGTNMTSLQFYNAVKRDVLIPWNKNESEEWKDGSELAVADRGGFIYEPKVGIYDEVAELDFSSLYPTIMVRENLSGETVNCNCCPESTSRVPGLGHQICQRWQGIVPGSLDILLRKRGLYKTLKKEASDPFTKEVFEKRQAALKWILVCSFGYLGFKNARFGKIDAHITTCAFSRNVLKKVAEILEPRGFELVHGIVDSVWLRKPGAKAEEYQGLCEEFRHRLDLPVSFEGCYKWIVFLSSKVDPRVPVLNRYYGVFQDGTIKVRGIELRKHDTPDIVRKCQREMVAILSKANNSREFDTLIPEALEVMEEYASLVRKGRVQVSDLVISKNLSNDPAKYRNLVPQAVAAQKLSKVGKTLHGGQTISYILTPEKTGNPATRATPVELAEEGVEYDASKYVRLLHEAAKDILLPFRYGDPSSWNHSGRAVAVKAQ